MIKEFSAIKKRVLDDDIGKRDYTLKAQDVVVTQSGRIQFATEDDILNLIPNDHALGQISSRLGIPTKYAKKCMEENPFLFADHANYWLNDDEIREKGLFIRTKGELVRAVLSDRYSTLDNHYVMSTLDTVLRDGEIVDVKNIDIDPRYFNLRLVFPRMTMNLGTAQHKDNVMVGIHVTNSEVGSSSLRIDSCLYRLVCSNGMIARVGGDSLMAQRHSNLTNSEMENRVSEAILKAVQLGDSTIDKFGRLQEIKVDDPMEKLKELAKSEKYSDKFVDSLQESYITEKAITRDDSAYTLVNAFTRSAQLMPSFDRRVEVETFAGEVMNRFLGGKI